MRNHCSTASSSFRILNIIRNIPDSRRGLLTTTIFIMMPPFRYIPVYSVLWKLVHAFFHYDHIIIKKVRAIWFTARTFQSLHFSYDAIYWRTSTWHYQHDSTPHKLHCLQLIYSFPFIPTQKATDGFLYFFHILHQTKFCFGLVPHQRTHRNVPKFTILNTSRIILADPIQHLSAYIAIWNEPKCKTRFEKDLSQLILIVFFYFLSVLLKIAPCFFSFSACMPPVLQSVFRELYFYLE